ncbi:MAG TPA: LLM class flavin-dependent oxidoreductase, partial [Solirubrobacteraceae bacterium]|nr:LLM class flavin-dependent oxidoreductase [Solirubrobacteraceae bacterium]
RRLPTISGMRVSVLDQSPISEGMTGSQALHNTIDLARLADALGYHRYWVAEHHGGPMLAGAAPEVLIPAIASATSSIRVGSGGVMLPHYSPFKVAEVFSLLAGLFPGRIDMGIGRAAGTDPLTTYALQRDRRQASPDDFPEQLAELLAYLEDDMPEEHPFARLSKTLPGRPEVPERWLLGSSPQSAVWAAEIGLAYAFADFIYPGGATLTADYRTRHAAEHRDRAPRTAVAVWAICAETDEEAQYLAAPSRMSMRMLRQGTLIPVPTPEKAIDYLRAIGQPVETGWIEGRRGIIGAPPTVAAKLHEVADAYGAEEVIVVTITHDHAARRRSYELIAEAVGLESREADGYDDADTAASAA